MRFIFVLNSFAC